MAVGGGEVKHWDPFVKHNEKTLSRCRERERGWSLFFFFMVSFRGNKEEVNE